MQMSTPMSMRARSSASAPQTGTDGAPSFFQAHPIGEIIRGLFLSSVLWVLIAIGVYMVYSMVLGVS